MSDRPLTIIFISVAILVALYLRRLRPQMVSPEQAAAEGKKRGVEVQLSQPITRKMFEELLR